MRVDKILNNIDIIKADESVLELDAVDISADSRSACDGSLFFAYKGVDFDSHNVAADLYRGGSIIGVVAEKDLSPVPTVVVENGRRAFAEACCNFFGRPSRELTMVGVTGTNGKTSITWILERIFNHAGFKTVRIGTTGANVAGSEYVLDNTTPSPYDFNRFLAEGVENGAEIAIAEVSSHALEQDRLAGIKFDVAVFTNLTGDHLDYHKTMENYYEAKKILFTDRYSIASVININDYFGAKLYAEVEGEKLSYGLSHGDLSISGYDMSLDGMTLKILYRENEYNIKTSLTGRHNIENILAVTGAALLLKMPMETIATGIAALPNVPGRLEKYCAAGVTAFVDYAHTDDALKSVLSSLRELTEGNIITVFGAGGNRDRTKRPRMGKVAQDFSDFVIVTSDNPRTEEPMDIINDILSGMERRSLMVQSDREKAIHEAVQQAVEGDIVVIAGKGHEDYQIIGTVKLPFSDAKVLNEALKIKQGKV